MSSRNLSSAPGKRTLTRGAAILLGLALATGPVFTAPASAAETLQVDLTQTTGTPSFDADDAPGHDSGEANDIVRTNDTVTYVAGIRYEGGDQTTPTIGFTLPRGQELVSLPPFCLDGSAVTPESLADPVVPVTPTSYLSLPAQTVSCVVEDQTEGTSLNYDFVARVRPEVPNSTILGPVKATATSDQVTEPAESTPVSQVVSAAAHFDVSKRGTATTDVTGPQFANFAPCAFDLNRGCRRTYYPLTISAPPGGKGITPLASPITLVDDLSPDAVYGAGTTTSEAWLAAGAGAMDKYGPRLWGCQGANFNIRNGVPYSSTAGNNTEANSVRESGTINCTQQAVAGAQSTITIAGADTTAFTVPTTSQDGTTLPGDAAYVVSFTVVVDVPIEAIQDLGTAVGGVDTLTYTNRYTDFQALDINGAPNTGDVLANNARELTVRLESVGNFSKQFVGVSGTAGNTDPGTFQPGAGYYEGPPGSGSLRDGNTVVVPGQTVLSSLTGTQIMVAGTGDIFDRTRVMCDTWDESTLRMPTTFATPGGGGSFLTYRPSGGAPAWIAGWALGNDKQASIDGLPNLKFQYGYTATPGAGAASLCTTGDWYDSIDAVPTAQQADGLWTGVNRVRVSYSSYNNATSGAFFVNAAIALRVLDTGAPIGTKLPNWASSVIADGSMPLEAVLAAPARITSTSLYNPETHSGPLGDRLILGGVTARINKFVRDTHGVFTSEGVPEYTSGSQVEYRLSPTLTSDVAAAGTGYDVSVEDCLPASLQFVAAHRESSGDPIVPVSMQDGAPGGSELACAADETYIRWDLGPNEANVPIDPIVYTVELLETARNGTYTNTALVSSPGDPSPAALRDDTAQVQVRTPTGIKISKSTPQNVVEINPVGVLAPRQLHWTVEFANIDSPADVSDVDVIDVLPADGVGDSDFTGTLAFDSADVATGTGIQILYTRAAPAGLDADATHGSNGPAGTTVWCDADSGGAVVVGSGTASDCPASPGEVTGLRFLRPGAFDTDDNFSVDVTMTPSGNAGGDVYDNVTSGRATGVSQPVGPASRSISIVESSIGNFVWEDLDKNGIQDPGEPPVPNFPVRLIGTDLDGNPVDLSMTTGPNGEYEFTGLASGSYHLVFDPDGLGSAGTFTVQDAITPSNSDNDAAVNSDGDPTTGVTATFPLAPDSADPNWDEGIVIDRKADISIVKQLVPGYPQINDDGTSKAAYDIVVTNQGNAAGPYDLKDILAYSEGITILGGSVTPPDGVTANPAWDGVTETTIVTGQNLPAGQTDTYRVVVDAKVPTTITTSEADCKLATHESGTGLLNTATLTFDTTTYEDVSCGTVDPPEEPGEPTDPATPTDPGTPSQPGTPGGSATPSQPASPGGHDEAGGQLPRTGANAFAPALGGAVVLLAGVLLVGVLRRRGSR